MKQIKIQEILSLSSLTMVDPEYTQFTQYIKQGHYTSARLFIDNFIEDFYEKHDEEYPDFVAQCKRLDRLENLVLDLIIEATTVYDEKSKRVRPRIKQ